MTNWIYVIVLVLALTGASEPGESKWVTVHSSEPPFSIDLPCECPTSDPVPGPRFSTPLGFHPARNALGCYCSSGLLPSRPAGRLHGATISVIYADYPNKLLDEFAVKELLRVAVSSPNMSRLGYIISWDRESSCGDYPGREIRYQPAEPTSDLAWAWQRACLVEARMYKIGVTGHQSDDERIQRLFDSFRPRPEPN